ncbi:MAG: hypothetical protein QM607_03220, partial [Microbacterium sp.]
GVPAATGLSELEITGDTSTGTSTSSAQATATIKGVRGSDGATVTVSAPLPAVVSITEAFPDPRFPNFKGIMAAKKKPYETWSLADLDVDPFRDDVAHSILIGVAQKPPRQAGVKVTDEGDGGTKLAQFLIDNKLV